MSGRTELEGDLRDAGEGVRELVSRVVISANERDVYRQSVPVHLCEQEYINYIEYTNYIEYINYVDRTMLRC